MRSSRDAISSEAIIRKQSIQIAFRPCDARFDVADAAIRRDPEFIHNISELWSGEHARNRFVKDFIKKLREYRPVSEQEEDKLNESIDKLYDLQHYPFTALELSPNIDEERVAEPDQLLRVCVGLGFRRARLNYVYLILRGKDLETEQFSEERRIQQFEVLKDSQARVLDLQNWHEFLKVLIRAGFRSSSMISPQAALLYSYVMFLIGKYDFKMDLYELRNLVARWFFMTTLTARYSASPETTMEADLARLRSINDTASFVKNFDQVISDTLTEDFWAITLPNEIATSSPRSPSLFAYYAALNLLGARVLFSKMKVSELLDPAIKGKKAGTERHHLFPKNYLKKMNITTTKT